MKYLKVWTDFEQVVEPLKDDEIGRLFLIMLRYARDGEEPTEFEGNEAFIWPTAKRDIDMAAERNEKLRQNGLKGGRPKATETKENQTEPNETKENQTKAEKKRNEMKGNEKKRNDSTGEAKRFTPPTLEEVSEYCRERGNGVNPQRFIDFYASKGWKVGNQPMKDWQACVRTWEQRDGKPAKKVVAQDFPQRDYSDVDRLMMEELAREVEKARDAG